MNNLYNEIDEFSNLMDIYIERCCSLIDSYASYSYADNFMVESGNTEEELSIIEDEKIESILDKASKKSSSRLIKTLNKTAKKITSLEEKVKQISKVKVHISDSWSFKKYIDNELDNILKDGDIENVYGRFFLTQYKNLSKMDSIQNQMRDMANVMRAPYKISIDDQGRVSEDTKRKDPIRDTGPTALGQLTAGIILNFTLGKPLKGTAYKNLFTATGVVNAVGASHPIAKVKRKLNGTYGNKYETVTIGELHKRLKELDPDKFAEVSDNEINNIRKFFTRNKKMRKLSKIDAESSKSAIRLAGKMVNLQAEYTAYRESIVNYYIRIINNAYSLIMKMNESTKKESEYVTESINLSALKNSIFKMKKSIEDSKKKYTIKKQKAAKNRIDEISIMIRNSSNEVRSTVLVIPDLNKFDDDIREIINYRISNTNADELLLPNINLLKKTTNRLEYIISELNAVDVDYNELDKYANSIYNSNDDIGGIKNNNVLYYPTSRYHYHGDLPYYPSASNKYRNFYSDPTYSYPGFPRHDKLEPEKITVENLYKRWIKGTTDAKYYEIIGAIENKFNEFLNGDTLERYATLNRKSNDKVVKTIYALYKLADKYNSFSIARYNYYCKALYRVLKHET